VPTTSCNCCNPHLQGRYYRAPGLTGVLEMYPGSPRGFNTCRHRSTQIPLRQFSPRACHTSKDSHLFRKVTALARPITADKHRTGSLSGDVIAELLRDATYNSVPRPFNLRI
jgi:hypothetical protein